MNEIDAEDQVVTEDERSPLGGIRFVTIFKVVDRELFHNDGDSPHYQIIVMGFVLCGGFAECMPGEINLTTGEDEQEEAQTLFDAFAPDSLHWVDSSFFSIGKFKIKFYRQQTKPVSLSEYESIVESFPQKIIPGPETKKGEYWYAGNTYVEGKLCNIIEGCMKSREEVIAQEFKMAGSPEQSSSIASLSAIARLPIDGDNRLVKICGVVKKLNITLTAKGDKMCFAMVEDSTGVTEVTIFPDAYKSVARLVESDHRLCITGMLSVDKQVLVCGRNGRIDLCK